MTKKHKLLVMTVSIVGAIVVLAQAAWADGKDVRIAESTQVTQAEHAAHHPEGAAGAESGMRQMMGEGNMGDKMKMMGEGSMENMMKMMQTPEGKALMEQCHELLEQQPKAEG